MIGGCYAVVERSESGEETATDYDSRSLMQFCQLHQLLLGAYEQLSRQNEETATSTQSAPSTTDEQDIKTVSLLSTDSSTQSYLNTHIPFERLLSRPTNVRYCLKCTYTEFCIFHFFKGGCQCPVDLVVLLTQLFSLLLHSLYFLSEIKCMYFVTFKCSDSKNAGRKRILT